MKSYESRIARLERILGPRSQKAALPPDDGGSFGHYPCEPKIARPETAPPPPEQTQPSPAYIAYMAAQAAQVPSHPPPQPAPPAYSKRRRKSAPKTPPVMDMGPLPAHRQFRGWRKESEDEQRRRVPSLVI